MDATKLSFDLFATSHDAIVTIFYSKTLPVDTFASVYIKAAAVRPSTGDSKSWFRTFTVKRRGAGAIIGTTTDIYTPVTDGSPTGWDLTSAVSGNDIQLRLTGQSGADIMWWFNITAFVLQE